MNGQTLTNFFMWCTIINGGLLLFWTAMLMLAPNLVYRTQRIWFPLTQEVFRVVMYSFLGLFKIFFLVFNAVPLVALLIVLSDRLIAAKRASDYRHSDVQTLLFGSCDS